jgi:hypothetical protein
MNGVYGTVPQAAPRGDLIVNEFTRLRDDTCDVEQRIKDASGPGVYQVTNLVPLQKDAMRVEIPNPTLLGREGFGFNNRAIDDDSRLRTNSTQEGRFRAPLHMQSRPFATVPYMGRGRGQPDIESGLIYADWARIERPCGTVTETFFANQFTPLVPHLQAHIQNSGNLIFEDAARGWSRGIPTRQFVRDLNA